MKAYGGVDVQLNTFLISAVDVDEQFHTLAALPPEKEPLVPIIYEAGWAPEPV
jgi:hypothetical protein